MHGGKHTPHHGKQVFHTLASLVHLLYYTQVKKEPLSLFSFGFGFKSKRILKIILDHFVEWSCFCDWQQLHLTFFFQFYFQISIE